MSTVILGMTPGIEQRRYQAEFKDYMNHHTPEHPARALCVWHRRAGKDLTALEQLAVMAWDTPGVYWHVLPTYEQARKACWMAFVNTTGRRLMDTVFPRPIVRRPQNGYLPAAEMLIELTNGSIVQFVGSDSIDSIVGAGPRGVNFSEFSLAKPTAWPLMRPMLRESRGWATFLFTPRGRNHAFKLLQMAKKNPGWFTSVRTIFETKAFKDPLAVLEEERKEGMPEEMVRQEYLCDFSAALIGSYWGDLLELLEHRGGLAEFEHPWDELQTVWDLGVNDSTAIWTFRNTDRGCDVVDYYQNSSKPLSHYLDHLDKLREDRGSPPYVMHWLPHDARQRTLVTGASVLESVVGHYGTGKVGLVPQLSRLDGIQAARWLLQRDIRIHPRCNEEPHIGVEALRQYHREYDLERKVFANNPEHDWTSHGADAFRYLAVIQRVSRHFTDKPPEPPPAPVITPASGAWSLDRLFEDEARDRGRRRGRV